MKLLTEQVNLDDVENLIEESATPGKKDYYIHGVMLQANRENKNRRLYPLDILQEEVARYTRDFINQNRAFGELGHPEGPTINLDRVSHMIKSLTQDGTNFIGKAKIMDTPYGKIAKNLIDEGSKLGVSSRALGSLKMQNGTNFVQGDLKLSTAADIVHDPSAHDAFVRGLMEDAEWIQVNGTWVPQYLEEAKKELMDSHKIDFEDKAIRLFEAYMSKL